MLWLPAARDGRTAGRTKRETMRLVIVLVLFFAIGTPVVAILWNAVNEVAAGDLGRLAVALPMLVLLAAVLVLFGRQIRELDPRS